MYRHAAAFNAAALALLTTVTSAAPTAPHWPGVNFHGVPETQPDTFDYNITNGEGTILGIGDSQNGSQAYGINFDKFNLTQFEQLQDALLGNHTLPSLNLTETTLREDGQRLLFTVESWISKLTAPSTTSSTFQNLETATPADAAALDSSSDIEDIINKLQSAIPVLATPTAALAKRDEQIMIAGTPVSSPLDSSEE